ncbi:MAG TPA: DUF4159 domain-containing protein [Vicinamibacterales bacterium]|nr:DUF4159 domain-containing protein [Vicinamibacterales bacterium]
MGRPMIVAAALALAFPIWAAAQFGSYRSFVSPNVKYDDKWVFTRLRYHPSSSWNHDYPRADRHLAYIVADISKVRAHTDGSNVLDLGDPEIFRHPLVYMSEPGFWDMTDAEARNLRQYLLKGGLILFDDFETTQWDNMAEQMRRVMPELRWIEIDVTHPVFHTFFDLKKIDYPHPMFPGMIPDYQALFEDNNPDGRMIALANHNNDLAEYWEWSDRGFFGIDPTNEAYRIGVNYVLYSLTH